MEDIFNPLLQFQAGSFELDLRIHALLKKGNVADAQKVLRIKILHFSMALRQVLKEDMGKIRLKACVQERVEAVCKEAEQILIETE